MAYIIGVDDVSKKVKDIAVGVDGTAKFVKTGYIGVDGVARKFYGRGYYEKRLYFFGYTGTLGTESLTNKVYSIKPDGTDPIEYTLSTSIYSFYTSTSSFYPDYATWGNIKPAQMYYDPVSQRLLVAGWNFPTFHYYVIDCKNNTIINHTEYHPTSFSKSSEVSFYYDAENGCLFFCCLILGVLYTSCFNIRTLNLYYNRYNSTYLNGRSFGMFAKVGNNNVARIVVGSNTVNVMDFDLSTQTMTYVSSDDLTSYTAATFLQPHPYLNKNQFNNIFGVVFSYNRTSPTMTNTGYIIGENGLANTISITNTENMVYRNFGFSNTHGAVWIQGTNGANLGKYNISYTETTNPTGSMSNNSGRVYTGPVIGGCIITGYTSNSTAVIYANISGSYYNITPNSYGAINNPICEGINLKEVLIPNNNQFLVYDFNQAAYTTPISVSAAMTTYNISPIPYNALLTWTKDEQDALVNLGY